jgi:iron complex outermembrane receptor protein
MQKLYKLTIAFIIILLHGTMCAMAQSNHGKINGKITTSDGKPGAYVSVGLKGSSKGTVSDDNGHYTIDGIKPGT